MIQQLEIFTTESMRRGYDRLVSKMIRSAYSTLPPMHAAMTKEEQFAAWKQQPGAGQILRQVYRFAAPYGRRYVATGRGVSIKLIWELARDHVPAVRKRAKAMGIALADWNGYTLNNDFTAYVARHIIDRRPEWAGMFELRATAEETAREVLRVAMGVNEA